MEDKSKPTVAGKAAEPAEQSTKQPPKSTFRDATKENLGHGVLLMGEVVARQWKALAQRRAEKPGSSSASEAPQMPESARRWGAYNPMETPDEDAPDTPLTQEQIELMKELVERQQKT